MTFQKGIPYAETLQRLDRAFSPKTGDLFTHDQLNAIIQADPIRYRGILNAWMRDLRARGLRPTGMGRARGIGIVFLDGREDVADIDHRMILSGRAVKRLAKRADTADTTIFTEPELAQHNLRRRLVGAAAAEIDKSNKELKAPPAIVGDNVRVLKTS